MHIYKGEEITQSVRKGPLAFLQRPHSCGPCFLSGPLTFLSDLIFRCTIDNRVTRVAWLNRSTILYAGNDKWSIDPRVIILVNTPTQYSIMIQNVDVYDEGPYTCSVQTDNHPKTSRVHLIVQGKLQLSSEVDAPFSDGGQECFRLCSVHVGR